MRVFSLLEASAGSRIIHPAPTAGTMHEHKIDARVKTNDGHQAASCSNRDTNLLKEWACDRKGEVWKVETAAEKRVFAGQTRYQPPP
jgi:hypothetical protein